MPHVWSRASLAAVAAVAGSAAFQARAQDPATAPTEEAEAAPEPQTAQEPEAADQEKAKAAQEKGVLPIPEYGGDLWTRQVLTGDWGGTRADLADKGVQLNIDFVQTMQSIVSGGRKTATRYGGSLDYLVYLDLYRMGLVPGAAVKIRAETRYGESVNNIAGPLQATSTDGFFPISPTDVAITVTDLVWYQFFSEHFGISVGKVDTLDGDPNPFASGRGNTQFLSTAFVFPAVAALSVPYSTLAAGVIVKPCENILISSSVMNSTDASTTTGFEDFGDGATWITEADFQYSLGGLPGGQNLGVLYAWGRDYTNFSGQFVFQPGQGLIPPTSDDTWAVYWSGWQYLHTEEEVTSPISLDNSAPRIQGIGLFMRAGIADQSTNPVQWTVSGGVGGKGVIPGRDNDMFGIGYYYSGVVTGRLTTGLGFHDNTQVFEAFYNLAITPAAQLTFDLQVGRGPWPLLDPAVTLGMRLFLNF